MFIYIYIDDTLIVMQHTSEKKPVTTICVIYSYTVRFIKEQQKLAGTTICTTDF